MDAKFLETFYETVILPQYDEIVVEGITWIDHGSIGLDSTAHYFRDRTGREYVLVFEDFPDGSVFGDGLSHEIVPVHGEISLRFGGDKSFKDIENITGYFTLFREKPRR
ncbi:hypothetical protein CR983_01080 [Candidatus Saccharibacteria bacterium]|nr:MAG: hypothetical protein CR983_01080 [Candidatus Saccharibacteria bacterium]